MFYQVDVGVLMREFYTIREVARNFGWGLSLILDLLIYKKEAKAYLYLSNKDNPKIIKPGFFPLPKHVFEELATKVSERSQDFGSFLLEILHTVEPKSFGTYNTFRSVDDCVENYTISIPSNLIEFSPFYRITPIRAKQTYENLISQGYSDVAARNILVSAEDPLWSIISNMDQFAISAQQITPDNIYVMKKSAIIDEITKFDGSLDSYELQLIAQMKPEIFDIEGYQDKNYDMYAEKWLTGKHPNIPKDALERIVHVSKPNRCRKMKWWLNIDRKRKF